MRAPGAHHGGDGWEEVHGSLHLNFDAHPAMDAALERMLPPGQTGDIEMAALKPLVFETCRSLCKSPLGPYAWVEALSGPEDVIYLQDLPGQGNDICGVADKIERRREINVIHQEREGAVGIGSYQRTAVGLRR
jgi:hypothetical protein